MSTAPVNAGPNTTVKSNNTVNSSGPTAANATQATTTSAAGNLTARTNDAPLQSSGPNLAANKLPTLPPPKAFEMSDASMSAFIGSLTNDYSLLSIKTATQNIDSNAKRIKEENQVQAAKLKEQQQALQESKNKSWFAKLWGYVSKVAMLVAGAAMIAASGGTASVLAGYMIYTAVAGLVKSIGKDTGLYNADFLPSSLGDAVSKVLVLSGVDKEKAASIGGWVDVAVAVASVGAMGYAMLSKKAVESGTSVLTQTVGRLKMTSVAARVSVGSTVLGGGSQIGQNVAGLQASNANAVAQTAQADSQNSRAILERAKAMLDSESELIKSVQQSIQELNTFVMDFANVNASKTTALNKTMA